MNILLVDDDDAILRNLEKFLSTLNFSIYKCHNGKEAVRMLKKQAINVVLSDIRMPVMDGMDLLKKIKGSPDFAGVAVLLFTGHGEVKSAVEAMKNGAYDYLLKPIDLEELLTILERIREIQQLRDENRKLKENFQGEVDKATQNIKDELHEVQQALAREAGVGEIGIFTSAMKEVYETAEKFHNNASIPVLIEGETGTGKELVARYIHYGRGDIVKPFVGLNCAAISAGLFESELFGYEAGAFTGGIPKGQKGKLEFAYGGSIFLDEITEMPMEHQAKLLRVIQEKEFFRVGGLKKIEANVRFICATNQDLKNLINEGKFRRDLYFRLNVGFLRIPPLRERKEEIVPLANMFLNQMMKQKKTTFRSISPEAAQRLERYSWPGNVRELKNAIERIAILWEDDELLPHHLDYLFMDDVSIHLSNDMKVELREENFNLPASSFDLNKFSLEVVRKALEQFNWNQTKTAQYLGITLRVLHTYLKKIRTGE